VIEELIGCVAEKLDTSVRDIAEDPVGGGVCDYLGNAWSGSSGGIFFKGHEHIRTVDWNADPDSREGVYQFGGTIRSREHWG
jgi:hypothetical protein